MEIGLLILRLAVGLTLAGHGAQKLFGWFGGYGLSGTGQYLESIGFYPGRRQAAAAGVVEVAGGLLLALGFLTPLAAALIASVMVVAAVAVHAGNGFFATAGGYEYNLILGVASLALAFTGPGALSIDAVLGTAVSGATWGLAAAAVAVLGAAAQLAGRRSTAAVQSTPVGA